MFIPDSGPLFFHPRSLIHDQKDSGSASKYLSIFNPKNCFKALGNMIEMFIPDPDLDFFTHPGSRG
jgi:hypothetical protein